MENNNKLIAEFLGLETIRFDKEMYLLKWRENLVQPKDDTIFKFDTDWNWLIQAVDKIESIEDGKFDVDILKNGTQVINYKSGGEIIINNVAEINYSEKINHVYDAVVEFIKWYNEQ